MVSLETYKETSKLLHSIAALLKYMANGKTICCSQHIPNTSLKACTSPF